MAMFEAAKPTIPRNIRTVYEDIEQIATVHEKEEHDIDKEIADLLVNGEQLNVHPGSQIHALIEQKRAIRSRTEKDPSGQKRLKQ